MAQGWTFSKEIGWEESSGGWAAPAPPATSPGRQTMISAPSGPGPVFVNMTTTNEIVYAPGVMVNEG
jgi:hypothetical protein